MIRQLSLLPCITFNRTSSRDLAVIWMLAVEMTVLPRRVTNTSEIMLTLRLSALVVSTLEMLCSVQERKITIRIIKNTLERKFVD